MAVYKGAEFTGRVQVDGNVYASCTFEDVILVYAGGDPPSFAGCIFRNWRFEFEGAAGATINFLKSLAPKQSGMSDVLRETFPEIAAAPAARKAEIRPAEPRPATPPPAPTSH